MKQLFSNINTVSSEAMSNHDFMHKILNTVSIFPKSNTLMNLNRNEDISDFGFDDLMNRKPAFMTQNDTSFAEVRSPRSIYRKMFSQMFS